MDQLHLDQSLFAAYATELQNELELLKTVGNLSFQSWDVDWVHAQNISLMPDKKKPWHEIQVFKDILARKNDPAVYFFTCDPNAAEGIYTNLLSNKTNKINNISHVPKVYRGGSCIYVGSRKDGLHGRLIQHLGFREKGGETGALYLYNAIKNIPELPKITFHFALLDRKYRNVTTHIESVIQDTLNPFIGKRAIQKLEQLKVLVP